jgi:hypothetical protein
VLPTKGLAFAVAFVAGLAELAAFAVVVVIEIKTAARRKRVTHFLPP